MQKILKVLISLLILSMSAYADQVITDDILNNRFGYDIAISNNFMIVGAKGSSDLKGNVYIYSYQNNEWFFTQELIPSKPISTYGVSVSISYPYAVVAAGIQGSFVFKHEGEQWIETAILADGVNGNVTAISKSGEFAAIGDPNGNSGTVGIFQKTGELWTKTQVIQPPTTQTYSHFGALVSMCQERLLITGTITEGGNDFGRAFVYKYDGTWLKEAELVSPSNVITFGTSIDIDTDYIAIGGATAINDSVFIYKRIEGDWEQTQIIINDEAFYSFGESVDITDKLLIVGAPERDERRGGAYIYNNKGGLWDYKGKIYVENARTDDLYGYSVAISTENAVLGGPCEDLIEHEGHVATYRDYIKDNPTPDNSSGGSGSGGGCFINTLF